MRIDRIVAQHRRDFRAIFVCEFCKEEEEQVGYDDGHFHNKVIPSMVCKSCGNTSAKDYRPLAPKYADGVEI